MTSNDETRSEVSIVPVRVPIPADGVIDATWRALKTVYDPELYLDVISLGLVYDVREENGTIVVIMTLTTPGCPASESLTEMTRDAIIRVVGDSTPVDVRLVWDPPWNPAMINAEAAAALGFRER
jgi:metal-sulfur cluster biosynthetic enzyme